MGAAETWAGLDDCWQQAFVEAWASWRAGCWGIGAVITDTDGAVISRGRNRILEAATQPGVIAGTPLAHAEMNALADLPGGRTDRFRLYTTLEPCVMCASAIRLLGLPDVRFAGSDPLFDGFHEHLDAHPFGAERPCTLTGPLDGALGRFASLLPLTFLAFWASQGPVFAVHRQVTPELASLAEWVLADGTLRSVVDEGGDVVDALDAVWEDLA